MPILKNLNPKQQEAVQCTEGPLLILAGAGSGKTRVLTHRIAYLIFEKKVYPGNILAITFTNKAAREMRERLEKLIGPGAEQLWASTFHSTCVKILRREITALEYTSDFVIYDDADQQTLIKMILKDMNIDDKKYPPRTVSNKISGYKNELKLPEQAGLIAENYYEEQITEIYAEYQKRLKNNNAVDFDDLILLTVKLFEQNPDILNKYQTRFQYILVDEYQDTNTSQYMLVKLLAQNHKNLCVVGDEDQCLTEGMLINTDKGQVPIENIQEGQKVITPSGRGQVMSGIVEKVMKKEYQGPIVKVKTKSGKVLKATPNHIVFAKLNPLPDVYYIYLMYKKGYGYRIGKTQGVRSGNQGEIASGLRIRLNQEHADKMWILKVCNNKEEATYFEQMLAFKYGIPTTVFSAKFRNITLKQLHIDKIFQEIDTDKAVVKLMDDLLLFEQFPHYMCNAVIRGTISRRIVNITFFGGRETSQDAGWCSHRISLNTSGKDLKEKTKDNNFPVGCGNRNTWRIETERKEYDEAIQYVKRIAVLDDELEIVKKARLTSGNSFSYMPISHLRPSMVIAINKNGKIVEDTVEKVTIENYTGHVYDLSVPHFRQYICEDIVVHNSIYQWRGADIRNILSFEKDYPDAQIIKLEQNYRSTQNILDAANKVIENNLGRKGKNLWTDKKGGDKIYYYTAQDEKEEVLFIARKVKELQQIKGMKYKDFAVLCRVTGQFRAIEEGLIRSNIPYRIYGGTKFYDRKEIKDIMAYLKVIVNPADNLSLKRIINTPKRGIGDSSWDKLFNYASAQGLNVYDILDNPEQAGISTRISNTIKSFKKLMDEFHQISRKKFVTFLTNKILEDTGYIQELQNEKSVEAETRLENLQEFLSVTKDYDTKTQGGDLAAFLAEISLMTDTDNYDEDEDALVVMTMHGAKGLEFPVVFVTGMEEGIFPHGRSINSDDPDELEEERRLCYVALTRAQEKVFLTRAWRRTLYGRDSYNAPSRFIEEIPEEYLAGQDNKKREASFGSSISTRLKKDSSFQPRADSAFKIGDKVEHIKWGEGVVVTVLGQGEDAEIKVAFPDQGIKTLIAKYAPLKKIGC